MLYKNSKRSKTFKFCLPVVSLSKKMKIWQTSVKTNLEHEFTQNNLISRQNTSIFIYIIYDVYMHKSLSKKTIPYDTKTLVKYVYCQFIVTFCLQLPVWLPRETVKTFFVSSLCLVLNNFSMHVHSIHVNIKKWWLLLLLKTIIVIHDTCSSIICFVVLSSFLIIFFYYFCK